MSSEEFPGTEFPDTVADDDPAFDTGVSHQARGYDYLLGGKDYFAADREYVDSVAAIYSGAEATVRTNRAFLGRAVRFLAQEAGLSQFLDIGTGIPAPGSTHEIAQEVRPDARIVYVDNDPVVLAHARALLVGHEPGSTDYLDADLRDPENILRRAARTLDFSEPVGLLLIAVVHTLSDEDDPYRIVATLLDALPSGSYLALTHGTLDLVGPEIGAQIVELTRQMSHQQYAFRTRAEISRFFGGLDLVPPGMVQPQDWRPGPQDHTTEHVALWAGVARKP